MTAAGPGQSARVIISAAGTGRTRLGGKGEHTALGQKCVKPSSFPSCTNPFATFSRLLRDPSQRTGSSGTRRRDGLSWEARRRPHRGCASGDTFSRDLILYQCGGLLNLQSRMSPVKRKLFSH